MRYFRSLRYLLAALTALVVVWSFFDVGRRAFREHQKATERPITLTVLHWGTAAENQIVAALVERFMREHPNVQIKRIHASDFVSKLKTMMAAGTPPDLFYLSTDMLPEFAELELLNPLDGFLADAERAGQGAFLEDYYPILLDAFRYDTESGRTGAGKLYGLPKDFTTAVFYVNLDLFKAAQVPIPYAGWTWDEFETSMRKITALNGRPGFEGRRIYGGVFPIWHDTLRNIVWTFGGEFFGSSFRDVTLDERPAQEALEMIVRTRLVEKTIFNATGIAKDGGQEFINGNIGTIGPIGRWMVPTYRSIESFRWDVVPVPYRAKEHQASQLYTTAWAMSSAAKHPKEAFELIRFLSGPEGAAMQSELGLAVPPLQSVATSSTFLAPPGLPRIQSQVFLDAMAFARVQQIPREPQWTRIINDRITESIQLGERTPMANAKQIESLWLTELDSPLRKEKWPPLNWGWLVALSLTVAPAAGFGLYWRIRRQRLGALDRAQERAGFAFISPWVVGFIVLTLGPMLVSLLLSLSHWTALTPMTSARYVGSANYLQLFTKDPAFYQSLQVTLYYVVLAVPIGQTAALIVALLMNQEVRGIAIYRTVYFLPSVVSGVALAVLWLQILNSDYGLLNRMLMPLAEVFGTTPPDWFGRDARRWAIPAFVIMSLWGVGSGMVIYLAGLKGIPRYLYEAATIDGASRARQFFTITLPMLSPLIFYNFTMGIIGSFQVFTQAYVMTGAGPDNSTLFYVLNLYRHAFEFHNMGYASALAWVLFVILLGLTGLVFWGSKKLVYYEALKS